MTVCSTCKHSNYCEIVSGGYSSQVKSCRDYRKRKPMTNEEWLHTLNTEQLAEFVIKAMLFYDNAGITVLEAIKNAVEDNEKLSNYFIENVVEWLKQPHNSSK